MKNTHTTQTTTTLHAKTAQEVGVVQKVRAQGMQR